MLANLLVSRYVLSVSRNIGGARRFGQETRQLVFFTNLFTIRLWTMCKIMILSAASDKNNDILDRKKRKDNKRG